MIVLYDGRCSVCTRTARALEKLDRGRGKLRTVDFRGSTAESSRAGISAEQLEASMHTIAPDGRVRRGPDAVRHALRTVGLGAFSWVLGLPVIGAVFGRFYDWFARNRLRWFGLPDEALDHGGCGDSCALGDGSRE